SRPRAPCALPAGGIAIDIAYIGLLHLAVIDAGIGESKLCRLRAHHVIRRIGAGLDEGDHADTGDGGSRAHRFLQNYPLDCILPMGNIRDTGNQSQRRKTLSKWTDRPPPLAASRPGSPLKAAAAPATRSARPCCARRCSSSSNRAITALR